MFTLITLRRGIIFTCWLSPRNKQWLISITQRSLLFFIALILLAPKITKNSFLSWEFSIDSLSLPLIILSFWLIPVSLLARIGHLQKNSKKKIRLFITLTLLILISLIITFSSKNLLLFFIGFEGTLVPTLLLISRWGMKQERIEAGYYFVFYTLISSLPLLLGIIAIYNKTNHLSFLTFHKTLSFNKERTLALFCLIAFLVKVPIFGLHLWLPKAHVEAPVAGSMILAAILLKMGGYGFIRLTNIFITPFQKSLNELLIPFCCWGGALTSIICITQTDLKSLIAYSSVSHMSFMIAGLSIQAQWSLTGGIIVMIAHGFVSSALFCIANIFYERTGSRTLLVSRGLKSLFLLFPTLWLIFAAANLGLPPLPNAMGELIIFSSIIKHGLSNFIPSLMGIIFTGIFSLIIFQLLKRGSHFKWNKTTKTIKEREYSTLSLHFLPLIMLILNPNLLSI